MHHKKKTGHLITTGLFICLVLSLSVNYITNALVYTPGSLSPTAYDGSALVDNSLIGRFNRVFYRDADTLSFIREYEYRLFGTVNHDNVIAGRNQFLFRIEDKKYHYNYLKDYLGEQPFSIMESELILAELQRRQQFYKDLGSQYLLVIIPNAQTIYSEYMPAYLGEISANTRLELLYGYLRENGFSSILNMTSGLHHYKDKDMPLYNNTENTLNALGLYYTYLAVCTSFSANAYQTENVIMPETLRFFRHYTAGREIAKEAGLENVVKNDTVSLSNETRLNYKVVLNTGYALKTMRDDLGIADNSISSLLLQFTGERDRLLSELFYSNTFDFVTYQSGLDYSERAYEAAAPTVVVQFIYENELNLLLEAAYQ